jgi:hypothetical protein
MIFRTARRTMSWFAGLLALAFVAPVAAQVTAPAGDGTKLVTRSGLGAWMLREDPSLPRQNCAVRFIPTRSELPGLAIFGPTAKSPSATIMFSGADIPWTQKLQDVQVELAQKGLPAAHLPAKLLPREAGAREGVLVVTTGDLRQTLQSMRDSESGLQLRLNGAAIFQLDYDGLDKARSAMLGCVEGQVFAGATLREATAEIRPMGHSTIKGQAYYKAALLASRQYPPKDSRAVGLIWLTDEFNAWYEHVKAQKKLPGQISESIAKHFVSTRILDDEGRFEFTNLPAGNYMLVANYNIEKTRTEREVVGQTHVFAGNQHIGTNDHVVHWNYTVKEGTSYQKQVTIAKDGDTLDVPLDKSKLFCFLVCF